jgi:metal-responsive CopG/Arc/MetJ family transcriptional regulator
MIRTQIYLDKIQVQQIDLLAKKQKTEKAKIIRTLIQKGLTSEKKKQSAENPL